MTQNIVRATDGPHGRTLDPCTQYAGQIEARGTGVGRLAEIHLGGWPKKQSPDRFRPGLVRHLETSIKTKQRY